MEKRRKEEREGRGREGENIRPKTGIQLLNKMPMECKVLMEWVHTSNSASIVFVDI